MRWGAMPTPPPQPPYNDNIVNLQRAKIGNGILGCTMLMVHSRLFFFLIAHLKYLNKHNYIMSKVLNQQMSKTSVYESTG